MIGPRRARVVRPALVAVLLVAGLAGEPDLIEHSVMCSSMSSGDTVSLSCDDPELEARIKAEALTPQEAKAIGCPPIQFEDDQVTDEPPPSFAPDVIDVEPTYTPRTPDPAIAARVNQAWDRVERWLGAHASATLRKLKFGADPRIPAGWEANHGRRLPDDLYVSYLRHDGADGNLGAGFQLPPSYGLLSVSDIDYINWSNCEDLVESGDRDAADPENGVWHGSLLAVGSDSSGRELFVEPRTGRVGEAAWQEKLTYDGPMGWPSHVAMLEALAGALERGEALRDWYPVVTAGCELRWAEEPAPLRPGCAGGPRPSPTPTPTVEPTPEKPTTEELRAGGCLPPRRTPRVHMPGPGVSAEVNAVWRRLERWLARRAPATYKLLRPPARPLDIARSEAVMGLRFPDDLRASLLRHDGGGSWGFGPAPFYELMSAKDIRTEWKMLCDIGGDQLGYWWHGRLIPFADAHDGGNLFIDTRTGKTGEFFNEEGLTLEGDVVWPTYLALLKATTRSLETGRPIRGWRPKVVKGELQWESTRG
ncbi:SMI1/KNR4 family protein [Microbispora corallina]|uniref:SMI1/KNR4 family protein n=1 Tax=Microbispora corallina TaxID=83302 RepID=UPI001950D526|nr:SMI1/KNR4 family protein [Microbispora corallina]